MLNKGRKEFKAHRSKGADMNHDQVHQHVIHCWGGGFPFSSGVVQVCGSSIRSVAGAGS